MLCTATELILLTILQFLCVRCGRCVKMCVCHDVYVVRDTRHYVCHDVCAVSVDLRAVTRVMYMRYAQVFIRVTMCVTGIYICVTMCVMMRVRCMTRVTYVYLPTHMTYVTRVPYSSSCIVHVSLCVCVMTCMWCMIRVTEFVMMCVRCMTRVTYVYLPIHVTYITRVTCSSS